MRWDELTARQKVEHVIHDILEWTYFPTWDVMYTAKWALEHTEAMRYPYAFWNDQQDRVAVFYQSDEDAQPFEPLSSIDDAWILLWHLCIRHIDIRHDFFHKTDVYGDQVWLWVCQFEYERKRHSGIARHVGEAICIAAMKAIGKDLMNVV